MIAESLQPILGRTARPLADERAFGHRLVEEAENGLRIKRLNPLKGPNIASFPLGAFDAPLVGLSAALGDKRYPVNGGTPCQEGMSQGRAAVVGQGADMGVSRELVVFRRPAASIANEVQPLEGDGAGAVFGAVIGVTREFLRMTGALATTPMPPPSRGMGSL